MPFAPLSLGKLRGLACTSTSAGVFAILAFDHRGTFKKILDPSGSRAVEYAEIAQVKSSVVRSLAPAASAVLLDPIYGLASAIASGALPGHSGLLVSVEESGSAGPSQPTRFLPGWSVAQAARAGANAIKLLIPYHPGAGEFAEQQEMLARQVVEDCRLADLPLFLEAVMLKTDPEQSAAAFAAQRPDLVVESARRLGALGADVLKLEFPVDWRYDTDETNWKAACEAVTAAAPCAWAVLSGGVEFDVFARQVEFACRAGASGFIAGRAVWQEGIPLPEDARQAWLQEIALPRLHRLCEIANQFARPWQSALPLPAWPFPSGWYADFK